ncbi:MAG TPA: SRPBCC family protein [Ferruginibacter sp.]|nr:SRPBCC family protein [Ferruginibacter sp.]
MKTQSKTAITVETNLNAPIGKVWKYWTDPKHITRWYNASDDWHAPYAENDLKINGKFKTNMAAKDGSAAFDFEGVYTNIRENELIEYNIIDGRKVSITFTATGNQTKVVESFEPENIHSLELQQGGWQSILDNFKKYTEEDK